MTTPLGLLGLPAGSSPAQIKEAWRGLARKHHPDLGGDQAEFVKLKQAYERAMSDAQGELCPACGGSCFTTLRRGIQSVTMPCSECGGTGRRWRD